MPQDPLGQNARHVQDTGRINQNTGAKRRLSTLRAMAAKGIAQRDLFLLYQSVILFVSDYGLGLTTQSQSKLLKFDKAQNESTRVILRTSKDTHTHIGDLSYLLD